MTGKVTIVGGGLTGVLAALEAHRLGARDIVLHEHFDQLGGHALSRMAHGLELRHDRIYFGAPGDPVRALLQAHGAAFEDFERRCGSVSLGRDGQPVWVEGLDGPALHARIHERRPQIGDTLTDRLRTYPDDMAEALTRYCQWRLGVWLNEVHESAAGPLAIDGVLPLGRDSALPAPAALGGASLPRGGFSTMFSQLRRSLAALDVTVHDTSLYSPRQALAECASGDTLVWAANPMPLLAPLGIEAPSTIHKSFATYLFKATYDGPLPFYAQNFTAVGGVFRIYLYESRGQVLALAECVRECGEDELRREIVRLMAGFGGASLTLGEQVDQRVGPRWVYHSCDAMLKLKAARARLARTHGAAFVAGGWEPYAMSEKFAQLSAGLAAALDAPPLAAVA